MKVDSERDLIKKVDQLGTLESKEQHSDGSLGFLGFVLFSFFCLIHPYKVLEKLTTRKCQQVEGKKKKKKPGKKCFLSSQKIGKREGNK